MYPLQHAHTTSLLSVLQLAHRQGVNATICYPGAFHKPYSLQFREPGKLRNAGVRQVTAACKVDVPDAVARFRKRLNRVIGNACTMAEVDVVQVLAELRNGKDCSVGDLSTFCENEVAQSRTRLDDPLYALIAKFVAVRQVEDPQRLECKGWLRRDGKIDEGFVVDTRTMRQSHFSEMLT